MNDSIKTTLAFVGGAALGGVLGVLLAPDKGSETRKKIVSKAKDVADGVTDAAKQKYEELMHGKDHKNYSKKSDDEFVKKTLAGHS